MGEDGYHSDMKKLRYLWGIPALVAAPVSAEVRNAEDNGFVIFHTAEISASPDEIWKRLLAPKDWWQKEHSWSGSSEGFSIEPKAGGCFCELFQEKQEDGTQKTVGSVEHMRVIFARPGMVLRMQGALGPLQSEAVTGTFTVAMAQQPGGKTSKLSFSYIVGGYMRYKMAAIAPAVDKVLAAQFASLIAPFQIAEVSPELPDGWKLDVKDLKRADESGTDDPADVVTRGDANDGVAADDAETSKPDDPAPKSSATVTPPPGKGGKPAAKVQSPVTDPASAAKKER